MSSQGRFQEAEDVFAALPAAARDVKQATTGLAATRAVIAMLRGDDAAARHYIDVCVQAERAGTRRRSVFPNVPGFALSLLSLVRIDSPESHAVLTQLLRTAERQALQHREEVGLVIDAVSAQSGNAVYLRVVLSPCFEVLADGLRCCWMGAFGGHGLDGWLRLMERYRSRAQANGFAWVAAECAATMNRIVELSGDHDGTVADGQALHAALGTQTLTSLALPIPTWERSLKALEKLAYDAKNDQSQKRDPKTVAPRRLVWDVDDAAYGIQLKPREQRQTKGGAWSKGRKVAVETTCRGGGIHALPSRGGPGGSGGDYCAALLGQHGICTWAAWPVRFGRASARLQLGCQPGGHRAPRPRIADRRRQ